MRSGRVLAIGVIAIAAALGALFTHHPSAQSLAQSTRRGVVMIQVASADGEASGSGFYVNDSLIVTNYHVVDGAKAIEAETSDGRTLTGITIIRIDPEHDLALLRTSDAGTALRLRADDGIAQGETVYAYGNPKGLSFTFSSGVVSSRRESDGVHLLQITAPLSHGSSGGPVVDGDGKVVGVSTSLIPGGQNLNFAVEVRHVRDLVDGKVADQLSRPPLSAVRHGIASVLDTGVYLITYAAVRPDSLAMTISQAGDSLVAEFGQPASFAAPSRQVRGALGRSLPASYDYGKPEVQFVIDSITSRRLFAGHFAIYQRGEVVTVPFTAARRHRSLNSTSLMLVDAGQTGGSEPTGASSSDGISVSGQIRWTNAGTIGAIGVLEVHELPGQKLARLGVLRDTIHAFLVRDSLAFTLGDLSCRVPIQTWPAAAASCWTRTHWYGITLAEGETHLVSRQFWRHVPRQFAGLVSARGDANGPVKLIYLTDDDTSAVSYKPAAQRRLRAWSAMLSDDDMTTSAALPWPETVAWYEERTEPRGARAAYLGHQRLGVSSGGTWDTLAIPPSVFESADDTSAEVFTEPITHDLTLVEVLSGKRCDLLRSMSTSRSEADQLSSCHRRAAWYIRHLARWVIGSVPASHTPRYWGWRAERLDDAHAILELSASHPESGEPFQRFFVVDTSGYHVLAPPLPDSANARLQVAQSAAVDGVVWLVTNYCARGDTRCSERKDVPKLLMRWTPGSQAGIVRVDSGDVLDGARLMPSDAGRMLLVSGSSVRLAEDWSIAAHFEMGRPEASILTVLDDRDNGTLTLVTHLGETVRVALPRPHATAPHAWLDVIRRWFRRS